VSALTTNPCLKILASKVAEAASDTKIQRAAENQVSHYLSRYDLGSRGYQEIAEDALSTTTLSLLSIFEQQKDCSLISAYNVQEAENLEIKKIGNYLVGSVTNYAITRLKRWSPADEDGKEAIRSRHDNVSRSEYSPDSAVRQLVDIFETEECSATIRVTG